MLGMDSSTREIFLDILCDWRPALHLFLVLNTILLILLVISNLLGSPSPGTAIVTSLSLVFLLGSMAGALIILRICVRRRT